MAPPCAALSTVPSVRQGPLPSTKALSLLSDLVAPHLHSFNTMLDVGLPAIVRGLAHRKMVLSSGDSLTFWLEDPAIERPSVGPGEGIADPRLLPVECRERSETYGGELSVCLVRQVNDEEPIRARHNMGRVPIMLRSARCHLEGMPPSELVQVGEEASECGGYFIVNGVDKIIRMLQIPKRNYPMAIRRGAYCKRGPLYSDKGVAMRCVRPADQSSVTLTLHYLADGSATARFAVKKQEFFLPVIILLKALAPTNDREIYERILAGDRGNTHLSDRLLLLLRGAKAYGRALQTQQSTLAYLGERFRSVLPELGAEESDAGAGAALLRGYVLVHIEEDPESGRRDKFNLLILMLRKLYAFVAGDVTEDNADSLAHQEVLMGGTLLQVFLKEKLAEYLDVRCWCSSLSVHPSLATTPLNICSPPTPPPPPPPPHPTPPHPPFPPRSPGY
jgi:DNA-directed RNA polymerase I subunit RPA2